MIDPKCVGCPNLAWQDEHSGECTGEHIGNCYQTSNNNKTEGNK